MFRCHLLIWGHVYYYRQCCLVTQRTSYLYRRNRDRNLFVQRVGKKDSVDSTQHSPIAMRKLMVTGSSDCLSIAQRLCDSVTIPHQTPWLLLRLAFSLPQLCTCLTLHPPDRVHDLKLHQLCVDPNALSVTGY